VRDHDDNVVVHRFDRVPEPLVSAWPNPFGQHNLLNRSTTHTKPPNTPKGVKHRPKFIIRPPHVNPKQAGQKGNECTIQFFTDWLNES
jgi:hypothetical protein